MLDIPKRLPLAAQVAASLRAAIEQGSWKETLPSERRLTEVFQVSRPTMRTALHLLAKDGLIEIRQGRPNRLLARTRVRAVDQNRLVGLIMDKPTSEIHENPFQSISEMRSHLAERGFDTKMLNCDARSAAAERRKLEEFVRQNRVFCCALISVSRELQQWFVTHSIPALVIGSCHASVRLPSLDVDYRAVCRHAAGVMLSHGHRRIVLLLPDFGLAGDLASEQGFLEAVVPRGRSGDARLSVVRHDSTASNIRSLLDTLFDSPEPPTGLVVAKPKHLLTVAFHLLQRGISVPGTVSLIARDQYSLFGDDSTPIAHYRFEENVYSNRLIRLMLQLASTGQLPAEPNLVFPRFFAGRTVASRSIGA